MLYQMFSFPESLGRIGDAVVLALDQPKNMKQLEHIKHKDRHEGSFILR